MVELLVALVATAAAAPVVRRVLMARGVLDVPNARSSHETPVARGGGIACAVGVVAAFAVATLIGDDAPWVLLVVALALAAGGLADDLVSLPPLPRLVMQAAAGAVMGWWVHPSVPTAVGVAVGAVVVLLMVNVTNFMDGINGISGLTAVVWGVSVTLTGSSADDRGLMVLGLATAGTGLGFLPFNLPAARLFLGDSGSYLLGALFSAGLLMAWQGGVPFAPVAAPLALYVVDVVFTLVRRAAAHDPLMQAHRDHVYQRLLRGSGLSHGTIALLVAGASALLTAAWLAPWQFATLVTGALVVAYLASPRLVPAT